MLGGLDGARVEVVRFLPLSLSIQGSPVQLQPLRAALRSRLAGSSRGFRVARMLRGSLCGARCLQVLRHFGLFHSMQYSRSCVIDEVSDVIARIRNGIEGFFGGANLKPIGMIFGIQTLAGFLELHLCIEAGNVLTTQSRG